MSEQAASALDNGIHGLAELLMDTPEEESNEQEEAASTEPEEDTDTQDEEANDEQEDSEEDAAEEPTPVATYKVTVKGEDGADTEVEVSTDELVKGYQRQADYTRKAQELSRREHEVTTMLTQKFTETREHYLQQAEAAKAAVLQIAGIKSQQELAEMAMNDPAGWVAEQQRQQYIGQILSQMDQAIVGERQRAASEQQSAYQQAYQSMYQHSWETLQKEGIDRDKLSGMYQEATKAYKFSDQELREVLDARQVLVLRDALAYRALQSKAKETTKKAQEAPRLPQKQTQPQQTRKDKALEQKFSSGRAKLNDLAAFLR